MQACMTDGNTVLCISKRCRVKAQRGGTCRHRSECSTSLQTRLAHTHTRAQCLLGSLHSSVHPECSSAVPLSQSCLLSAVPDPQLGNLELGPKRTHSECQVRGVYSHKSNEANLSPNHSITVLLPSSFLFAPVRQLGDLGERYVSSQVCPGGTQLPNGCRHANLCIFRQ